MKIKTVLKKENEIFENVVEASFENNTYFYKENDLNVSIKIDNNIEMIRENNDYKLKLFFINGAKTYNKLVLKEDNINLDIEVNTKEIIVKEHYLEIKYQMNEENCIFTLEGV